MRRLRDLLLHDAGPRATGYLSGLPVEGMNGTPDWYASGPGRSMCKKCGETPPGVQEVADGRGVQNYCAVCGHSWWIKGGPLTAADYKDTRGIVRCGPSNSIFAPKPKVGTDTPKEGTRVTDCSGVVMTDP
jgi:hypothetical protein